MTIGINGEGRKRDAHPRLPLFRALRGLRDMRGTPAFAPSPCNAIPAAAGTRIRELPIGDTLEA